MRAALRMLAQRFVLQHDAGLITLGAQQRVAGDVNNSGQPTAFDASLILQYAVGLIGLPFPGAGRVWAFDPPSRAYTPLVLDQSGQDFAGILIGGYALLNPPVSIAALILLTSLAALILGIALMTLGYKIRAATEREWMLYLAGALSIAFGIAMMLHPIFAGLSLALIAGAWALIVGVLRIVIAFKVRKLTTTAGKQLRAVS